MLNSSETDFPEFTLEEMYVDHEENCFWKLGNERFKVKFGVLKKSIRVLENSLKFIFEKGYESCHTKKFSSLVFSRYCWSAYTHGWVEGMGDFGVIAWFSELTELEAGSVVAGKEWRGNYWKWGGIRKILSWHNQNPPLPSPRWCIKTNLYIGSFNISVDSFPGYIAHTRPHSTRQAVAI